MKQGLDEKARAEWTHESHLIDIVKLDELMTQ
jgi:hypothetical protein